MKKFLMAFILILAAFFPSSSWSKDCVDCSVRPDPFPEVKKRDLYGMAHRDCHGLDQDFDRTTCASIRFATSYADFKSYFKKCGGGVNNKYKDIVSFLKHARCRYRFLDEKKDVRVTDIITADLNDYNYLDFYEAIIREKVKESRHSHYDRLKELAEVFNETNAHGQTLLDHLEETYANDHTVTGQGQKRVLHNMACRMGAYYKQHPKLNKDCLSKRMDIFVK